jgi:hypothetical protein
MKLMKVVRVDKDEFELEDGRVIPHVVELDVVPSIEEFQEILNEQYDKLGIDIDEDEEDTAEDE